MAYSMITMERIALLVSTLCYLFSFGHTLFVLGAGRFHPGKFNFIAMALGAAAQGWYLSLRGAAEHSCPLGTVPETLIFLSWSIALIYLVIGPSRHLLYSSCKSSPCSFPRDLGRGFSGPIRGWRLMRRFRSWPMARLVWRVSRGLCFCFKRGS